MNKTYRRFSEASMQFFNEEAQKKNFNSKAIGFFQDETEIKLKSEVLT